MTTSIIILAILAIIVGVGIVAFSGPSFLFRRIEKSYKKFLNDKENFSDENLQQLRIELEDALDELDFMIDNQSKFIASNSNEYSEYENDAFKSQESLAQREQTKTKFEKMLQGVSREIARREHAHKYK